jgi:hypothetical protein
MNFSSHIDVLTSAMYNTFAIMIQIRQLLDRKVINRTMNFIFKILREMKQICIKTLEELQKVDGILVQDGFKSQIIWAQFRQILFSQ